MRIFGSLSNRILESISQPAPTVGMGATIIYYSDRHAGTVVEVRGKTVFIARDHADRIDNNGMSDSQSYAYRPDLTARPVAYTLRKNGAYVRIGENMNSSPRVALGHRDERYDFGY